jgi:predicted rRNA methylase YqxC with S4 and FtsJ domains
VNINLVFLLVAILASCAQDPIISRKVSLNEQFTIKAGQQVAIKGEKLSVQFSSVQNESRCPTGVQCVWEGNAAVSIEASKKRKKAVQAILNTNIQPNELAYKKYRIRLLGLNPYPRIDEKIEAKDYEAVMIVTKD